MRSIYSLAALATFIILYPHVAFAYIDPGIVSTLFQGLFAMIFGAGAIWVMRPWNMIKNLINKIRPGNNKEYNQSGSNIE